MIKYPVNQTIERSNSNSQVVDSYGNSAPIRLYQPASTIQTKGTYLIAVVFVLLLTTLIVAYFIVTTATIDTSFASLLVNSFIGVNRPSRTYLLNKTNLVCGVQLVKPSILRKERIINGNKALEKSWPWAVSIGFVGLKKSTNHICGGTLISKRVVITAAHCVYPGSMLGLVGQSATNTDEVASMVRLYIGSNTASYDDLKSQYRAVKVIAISYINDISIIVLDRDVAESDEARFICLENRTKTVPGTRVYAVGWGTTDETTKTATTDLMQVSFTIKTKAKCGLSYEPTVQFCAGDDRLMKDTCYGDSGGPLMTADENNQFIFTGIVSFGDQSCRGRGIYTNVSYYYDWIVNNSLY